MIIIKRKEGGIAIPIRTEKTSKFGERNDVIRRDKGRAKCAFVNTVDNGVRGEAAERARGAQPVEGWVAKEVSLRVVSQVKQELLAHNWCLYDGRRRARKVQPAEIASD